MKEKLTKRKPYYLIIARKIIFFTVAILLCFAILILFFKKDADKYRVIFTIVQFIAMLFVLRLPNFIKNKYNIQIPNQLDFILIIFAFSGFILGDVFDFYGKFPIWDSLLHTLSGIIIAYVGFIVIDFLDKEYTIPISISPFFMSFIVISTALAIGAAWEIGEYLVDDIFHTNNQQYMQTTRGTLYGENDVPLQGHEALNDTMKDLMLDLAGAIAVATIEYKKLEKRQKEGSTKK